MIVEAETREILKRFVNALNAEIDRIQTKVRSEKLLRTELLNLMDDIEEMKAMLDEIEMRLFNSRVHS
jgi:hypothetical protein